ncbi:MAG: transcriptional regulator GcvA [Hyphomonadaceae bacterium]|nr:transcriptional regulator GcvA [Hyphomonadaceae bacterium]
MSSWYPPSISSIRAFEAAARLLSFTRAAAELNVTQSAVSHGVRDLERRFKVDLFFRDGRTLVLSDAGKLYLPFATEALGRLRLGERAIFDPQRKARVLTVSVSPSFAAKWLVPRLGAFSNAHPDLELRISANPQHIDFMDGEIDLAIRHGDGNWAGLECVRLCEESLFPVCSPSLFRGKPPRTPADLSKHTLIHHRATDAWKSWLRAFGVAAPGKDAHGLVVNEMSLAIDAAVSGQGVALVRSALAYRDIAEGRLVRPMSQSQPASFAYWIVCPRSNAGMPKIARFREWLLQQAVAESA